MSMTVLDTRNIRDISPDILDADGQLRVMPAAYYKETTREERALFGHRYGIYCLPTEELIAWLMERIVGKSAIEVGAGNGVIAKALGIRATDSCMQSDALIAALYASTGQPTVQYGANVEKLSAAQAVGKYKPDVVIGAWVTHKYEESRHAAGGNMLGIDEGRLLDGCREYIFIGNRQVHRGKEIWLLEHEVIEPDWLFSRSTNGSPDFISIWRNKLKDWKP